MPSKKSRQKPRKQPQPNKKLHDRQAAHRQWLERAEVIAQQSPHPTVKVGAILLDRKGRVIARSPNRFAHGVDNKVPARFRDGVKSLWINCAEQLAIAEALRRRADIKGGSFYLTLEPCAICAGLMAELQVKEVYVPVNALRRYARLKTKWKKSIEVGIVKLAEAGVRLCSIDLAPVKKKRI